MKLGFYGSDRFADAIFCGVAALHWVHHADTAHVGGCSEPHHRETGNRGLQGGGDGTVATDKSDVEARGRDDGNGPHAGVDDDLNVPVVELRFSQINTMMAPMPVSIFVRRPNCQRPSSRTAPIAVRISTGSWR
jgi:hypothetical protein